MRMKLHCEALYDSLTNDKNTLHGNDAFFLRTDRQHSLIVTKGKTTSASILAEKTRHLLSNHVSSLSSWEALITQLMNWGQDWQQLITIILYDDLSSNIMIAQFQTQHVCLYRDHQYVSLACKEIVFQQTKVYLCLIPIEADDFFCVFRNPRLWQEVGQHLGLGWQRDFGVNSSMMLKEQRPCARLYFNDVMMRVKQLIETDQDSLVCVFQLRQRRDGVLMLGPPSDHSLDEVAVRRLMRDASAIKMVCGGTTSEIVARCLGRRLILIPSSCTDIPPLSLIDDIDLVSEGVLTVQKTIDLLSLLNNMHSLVLTFHELYQYDGAFHLTKLLCSECTDIHFLIGLAQNKDHAYLNDISFQTKINMGQQLMSLLVQMGKYVTVEYL